MHNPDADPVALYAMSFVGMMPWGALLLGGLAEHLGPGTAIATDGISCCLAAAASFWERKDKLWSVKRPG